MLANVSDGVSAASISRLGLPFSMALAVIGRWAALYCAFRRPGQMRDNDQVLDDAILKAGEVSRPAAWIAGTLFARVFALALLGIVLAAIHDEPLPN